MIYYIGLDAHSRTCTYSVINSIDSQVLSGKFDTSEKNLRHFCKSLKGETHLTFEESGLSKWLYSVLHTEVNSLVVCQPSLLPKKKGPKTDLKDSLQLAKELKSGNLVSVFHDDLNPFIKMRTMVSHYQSITYDITRAKNRYKAIFRSDGNYKGGQKVYKQTEFIEELTSENSKMIADSIFYQIEVLSEIKKRYLDELQAFAKGNKINKLLCTIPGIDIVRASMIAAYTAEPKRFKNKHHYWAYCGLVRYVEVSDDVVYGSKKAQGRNELKHVFCGAGESVLRGNNTFRVHYDQLRTKGLDHRKAKKAVQRKLASVALSIFKTEKPYREHEKAVSKEVSKEGSKVEYSKPMTT